MRKAGKVYLGGLLWGCLILSISLFRHTVEVYRTRLIPSLYKASNKTKEDVEWLGINELKIADQHVHIVEEVLELDGFQVPLNDTHFGSGQ